MAVDGVGAGPGRTSDAGYALIGPDYFRTLGVSLIAGREFTRADAGVAPSVAIVNEAFVERFQLGQSAVGARLRIGDDAVPGIVIVGVVRDTKSQSGQGARPSTILPAVPSGGRRRQHYLLRPCHRGDFDRHAGDPGRHRSSRQHAAG